ncbi:MAG: hypothetical protein MZU97_06125 [Bacillus subtilis]|nr:hypothetical protein [Bacillus subtilis]
MTIQSTLVIPIRSEWGLHPIDLNPEGRYQLMQDIVLKDQSDSDQTCLISSMLGDFEGNGHSIVNLQLPLFCEANNIRNLTLLEVDIDLPETWVIGAVANQSIGTISNVHVFGQLKGEGWIGGLVATNEGTIVDSSFHGVIEGTGLIGGIAYLNKNTIERSYVTGTLSGSNRYRRNCRRSSRGIDKGLLYRCRNQR